MGTMGAWDCGVKERMAESAKHHAHGPRGGCWSPALKEHLEGKSNHRS